MFFCMKSKNIIFAIFFILFLNTSSQDDLTEQILCKGTFPKCLNSQTVILAIKISANIFIG